MYNLKMMLESATTRMRQLACWMCTDELRARIRKREVLLNRAPNSSCNVPPWVTENPLYRNESIILAYHSPLPHTIELWLIAHYF